MPRVIILFKYASPSNLWKIRARNWLVLISEKFLSVILLNSICGRDSYQGEIDVVGINTAKKKVYICEVATHLAGLQYVKERRPDNVERFVKKFEKDIEYSRRYLPEFEKVFMLWSPIVRTAKDGSQYNQMNDIDQIKK